jgi:hypothetical protein
LGGCDAQKSQSTRRKVVPLPPIAEIICLRVAFAANGCRENNFEFYAVCSAVSEARLEADDGERHPMSTPTVPEPSSGPRPPRDGGEPHPGRSDVQQSVEPLAMSYIAEELGIELEPRQIALGDGPSIRVNGASADNQVLVELNTHIGPLKGSQPHKLTADAFKLIWAGSRLDAKRLIIAVVGEETEKYLQRPKAWLTAALSDSQVEVMRVRLDQVVVQGIVEAQKRQYR